MPITRSSRDLTHSLRVLTLENGMNVPIPSSTRSLALAAEVRARRRALGLSQQDLADLAGVSERFVRFVEQGKPSIQLDALLGVLDALGLELVVRRRGT